MELEFRIHYDTKSYCVAMWHLWRFLIFRLLNGWSFSSPIHTFRCSFHIWLKLHSHALMYLISVNPKICIFPIHDYLMGKFPLPQFVCQLKLLQELNVLITLCRISKGVLKSFDAKHEINMVPSEVRQFCAQQQNQRQVFFLSNHDHGTKPAGYFLSPILGWSNYNKK